MVQVLENNVKKDEDNLMIKKTNKLERDITDYKNVQVFEWKHPIHERLKSTIHGRQDTNENSPRLFTNQNVHQNNKRSRDNNKNRNKYKQLGFNYSFTNRSTPPDTVDQELTIASAQGGLATETNQ